MAEKDSNVHSSSSEDMDVGEGEGQAVPVRSIATQSAPHSPAISASGENSDIATYPPQEKPHPRVYKEKVFHCVIPVLNRDTASLDTYDTELLLNKKVQKLVFSGHRMKSSRTPDIPKLLSCRSLNISIDRSRHSTPKYIHGSFDNRSLKLKMEIEKRFGKFKDNIAKFEIKECNFTPNYSKHKGKPPKSPKANLERLSMFSEKKCKRHPQSQSDEPSFKPEICEKSKKIVEKNPNGEPRHESLHRTYKSRSSKELAEAKVDRDYVCTTITVKEPEVQEPFRPAINQRSKNLLRANPFEENLNKKPMKSGNIFLANLCTSPRSEKVLIDKFTREFNALIDEDVYEITYAHLQELLRGLFFVLETEKNSDIEKETMLKLWEQLSVNEKIDKDQLLMFFLAILRYKPYLFSKNQEHLIAPEESDRIHKKYVLFYENRLSKINKSTINKSFKHSYDFPFKPEINSSFKSLNETASEELSNNEKVLVPKRSEKLKDEYLKSKEQECTFRPVLTSKQPKNALTKETGKETIAKEYYNIVNSKNDRTEALYNLATVYKEKANKKLRIKETNDMQLSAECTFTPKVNKKPQTWGSPSILGTEKVIQRLAKAREDKEQLQSVVEKGFPYQGDKKLPQTPKAGKEKIGNPKKPGEKSKPDPAKEKKLKEWEVAKVKEMKKIKEKEMKKQEKVEKMNSLAEQKRLSQMEEKKKSRIEKIGTKKVAAKNNKEKKGQYKYFDYVFDKDKQEEEQKSGNFHDKIEEIDDELGSSNEHGDQSNQETDLSRNCHESFSQPEKSGKSDGNENRQHYEEIGIISESIGKCTENKKNFSEADERKTEILEKPAENELLNELEIERQQNEKSGENNPQIEEFKAECGRKPLETDFQAEEYGNEAVEKPIEIEIAVVENIDEINEISLELKEEKAEAIEESAKIEIQNEEIEAASIEKPTELEFSVRETNIAALESEAQTDKEQTELVEETNIAQSELKDPKNPSDIIEDNAKDLKALEENKSCVETLPESTENAPANLEAADHEIQYNIEPNTEITEKTFNHDEEIKTYIENAAKVIEVCSTLDENKENPVEILHENIEIDDGKIENLHDTTENFEEIKGEIIEEQPKYHEKVQDEARDAVENCEKSSSRSIEEIKEEIIEKQLEDHEKVQDEVRDAVENCAKPTNSSCEEIKGEIMEKQLRDHEKVQDEARDAVEISEKPSLSSSEEMKGEVIEKQLNNHEKVQEESRDTVENIEKPSDSRSEEMKGEIIEKQFKDHEKDQDEAMDAVEKCEKSSVSSSEEIKEKAEGFETLEDILESNKDKIEDIKQELEASLHKESHEECNISPEIYLKEQERINENKENELETQTEHTLAEVIHEEIGSHCEIHMDANKVCEKGNDSSESSEESSIESQANPEGFETLDQILAANDENQTENGETLEKIQESPEFSRKVPEAIEEIKSNFEEKTDRTLDH